MGSMINVEVVSKKLIKPSNPTPNHLTSLNLSLFDQVAVPIYTDAIFYYLNTSTRSDQSATGISQLENSLSETLTCFYPLAGRLILHNPASINCGDQGVDFFEARVIGIELAEFLNHNFIEIQLLINKFLPWDNTPSAAALYTSPLLAIQINSFECGSIVLGLRISHVIADGSTVFRFINQWATLNRTSGSFDRILSPPNLSYDQFASLFPARESLYKAKLSLASPSKGTARPKVIARKFLFDEKVVSGIRNEAASSLGYKPTRVTVVIAIIWKALIGISKAKNGSLRNSVIAVAMNLRGKESVQLPDLTYGNFFTPVPVSFIASDHIDSKIGLNDLIILVGDTMREAKKTVANANTSDEISSIMINFRRELVEKRCGANEWEGNIFSSWCNFPAYEADFGWGKPFWVSSAIQEGEVIWLMDTRTGGGIEAWINLKEVDMLELEKDPDFLSLVSNQ